MDRATGQLLSDRLIVSNLRRNHIENCVSPLLATAVALNGSSPFDGSQAGPIFEQILNCHAYKGTWGKQFVIAELRDYWRHEVISSRPNNKSACISVVSSGNINSVSLHGISGEFAGRFLACPILRIGRVSVAAIDWLLRLLALNRDTDAQARGRRLADG